MAYSGALMGYERLRANQGNDGSLECLHGVPLQARCKTLTRRMGMEGATNGNAHETK